MLLHRPLTTPPDSPPRAPDSPPENPSPGDRNFVRPKGKRRITYLQKRPQVFTSERKERFLELVKRHGWLVHRHAHDKLVKVTASTIYQHLKNDPAFAERAAEAREAFAESVEAELHRRGVAGVLEPVYYQGKRCGSVKRYSDALLVKLLHRHRPEYKERTEADVRVTGAVAHVHADVAALVDSLDDEGRAALRLVLERAAALAAPAEAEAEGGTLDGGQPGAVLDVEAVEGQPGAVGSQERYGQPEAVRGGESDGSCADPAQDG